MIASTARWFPALGSRQGIVSAFRRQPYAVTLTLVLVGLAVPFATRSDTEWDRVFMGASRALVSGEDFYELPLGYTYPPFQSLLALPMLPVSKTAGRLMWFAINAVCLVWGMRAAWRLAGGGELPYQQRFREHFACWLGLIIGLGYAFNSLAHQQTDLVVFALVFIGLEQFSRGKTYRAAILWGLATAMKCTPLLLAPYLLIRGKPLGALALVGAALAASLAPDLIDHPKDHPTWLQKWHAMYIAPMTQPEYTPGIWASEIVYNQSFVGLSNRWTHTTWVIAERDIQIVHEPAEASPGELRRVLMLLALGCGGLALIGIISARLRQNPPENLPVIIAWEGCLVIAGMLLFSPMSSPAHFGLLLLPGFLLARLAFVERRRWPWGFLVLIVPMALLTNHDLWGEKIYSLGLWYGAATWATFLTLLASVTALCLGSHPRVSTPEAEPPTA